MTGFNYFKINDTKKIRYLKHNQKNSDYIVFLHGFMSDLEGKKPRTLLSFAKKNYYFQRELNATIMTYLYNNIDSMIESELTYTEQR